MIDLIFYGLAWFFKGAIMVMGGFVFGLAWKFSEYPWEKMLWTAWILSIWMSQVVAMGVFFFIFISVAILIPLCWIYLKQRASLNKLIEKMGRRIK